jgi:hypothetical protein
MTAGDVMDGSATLLNDTAKSVFTYAVQIPYLNIAQRELQEECESNNVPMSNSISAVIPIAVGVKTIGDITGPALPTDLIEIQGVYERLTGSSEDYQQVTRVEFLPLIVEVYEALIYFSWSKQIIRFLGATTPRDVKINYISTVLPNVTSSSDVIALFNAQSFLTYRTAALVAQFVGENKERADDLNVFARLGLDRVLNINTKGRQSIFTRRRPFMSSYKVRTGF